MLTNQNSLDFFTTLLGDRYIHVTTRGIQIHNQIFSLTDQIFSKIITHPQHINTIISDVRDHFISFLVLHNPHSNSPANYSIIKLY
jgi:hypothetical protein